MCLRQIALAGCVTKEPLQLCMCTVKRKKKIRYLVTSQHVTWNVLSTHIVKTCITKPNVATLLTLNPSHALKTFFFSFFFWLYRDVPLSRPLEEWCTPMVHVAFSLACLLVLNQSNIAELAVGPETGWWVAEWLRWQRWSDSNVVPFLWVTD